MTYDASAQLMNDTAFRGRIKVAVLNYASYILNEGPGVAGHTSRVRWAQQAYQMPDSVAQQIQPPVVMDGQVQADGAAITDQLLQVAVEGVVNKVI